MAGAYFIFERGFFMRTWFVEQGAFLYVMLGVILVGLISTAASGRSYQRLIREADLMGTSEHQLLKYIKLKFSSYYTLGMQPRNSEALVEKYLDKYKTLGIPLRIWEKLPRLAEVLILAIGAWGCVWHYRRDSVMSSVTLVLMSFIGVLVMEIFKTLSDCPGRRKMLKTDMMDYLDNYLKNKMDSDHGFIKPIKPAEAIAEGGGEAAMAAARPQRNRRRSPYDARDYMDRRGQGMDDEVDAQIVADVLKEFLN